MDVKKGIFTICFFMGMGAIWAVPLMHKDVYVIIYATYKGKTGHAGIAVDRYKIIYREIRSNSKITYQEDTVKTGELLYYDFWPNDDYFNAKRSGKNIPGIYYRLPEKLFEAITVNSLCDKGIPHKENYPCDALLKIATTVNCDYRFFSQMDSLVKMNREFNGRRFNCTDFVIEALIPVIGKKVVAKEFIPFTFSNTPNKLFRQLVKLPQVEVIRVSGNKTKKSFFSQRVLYKIFNHTAS